MFGMLGAVRDVGCRAAGFPNLGRRARGFPSDAGGVSDFFFFSALGRGRGQDAPR